MSEDDYALNSNYWASGEFIKTLKDLQQENKELKEQLENDIDRYEDTISYQLGYDSAKALYEKILIELEKWLREYFSINNGASNCPLSSQSEIKEMKIENKFILEILRRISELKEKYK